MKATESGTAAVDLHPSKPIVPAGVPAGSFLVVLAFRVINVQKVSSGKSAAA